MIIIIGIIIMITHAILLVPLQRPVEEVHGDVLVLAQPLDDKRLEPPGEQRTRFSGAQRNSIASQVKSSQLYLYSPVTVSKGCTGHMIVGHVITTPP